MAIAPVRVSPETRDDLKFIGRELSARYNQDYALGDVIRSLIHGYSGNPELARNLTEIIGRRPSAQLFPEEK